MKLARPLICLLCCAALSCDSPPQGKLGNADENKSDAPAVSRRAEEPSSKKELPQPASREPKGPPVLLLAPEFELTDQAATPFGTNDLRGRVWVANFMFTQCAATCPRQTAKLAELQQRVRRWPDWERIRLISFTVDPERDTVPKLHDYAELHQADHEHWKFLTGTRPELFQISKAGFKLPVSEAARDAKTPIAHSPQFILVDAERRIRGYYDSLSDADFAKLLVDLRFVLSEPTKFAQGTVHIGAPADVIDPPWLAQRQAEQLATANELNVYHDFEFTDRLETSGIDFVSRMVADAGREFKFNHYDHGTGVAVADVDGDGLSDVYFVRQVGGNQLWRNLGQARFENITDAAGVGLQGRVGVTASFADTDNDGDPDLFVTTTRHGNAFFENDGKGRFRNLTAESGLDYSGHSSSAEFFDYDRDGRLDLFLVNVGQFTTEEIGYSGKPGTQEHPYFVGSKKAFASHLVPALSERSILYHNEGGNNFRDVSEEVGLIHKGWSGDATPIDVNDDGWIDLYVLNMQGNDEYYQNIEGRKFERRSAAHFPESPWGATGVKSFDYDNDGRMDLFVTNMHSDMWQTRSSAWKDGLSGRLEKSKAPQDQMPEKYLRSRRPGKNIFGNVLYSHGDDGQFRDVSDDVNAESYWPWGVSAGDLNADGWQDLLITSSMNLFYRYHVNALRLNDHGTRFHDAEFILGVEPRRDGRTATPWFELDCAGADAKHELSAGRSGPAVVWGALGSRSSVIFDLDGDGDLDIVTNDFNSPPMVLTSNLDERNPNLRYLKIQLRGTRTNRDGLGAKVQITAAGKILTQVHDGQSGYLSQSSLPLYFGLDTAATVDRVSVQWPGGAVQVLEGPIETNRQLVIEEEDR